MFSRVSAIAKMWFDNILQRIYYMKCIVQKEGFFYGKFIWKDVR